MPKEIPGFYYDEEKNRYFPIKGRIPGSSLSASSSKATKQASKPSKVTGLYRRAEMVTSRLLLGRELYGKVIPFRKGKINFSEEIRKIQASRPLIKKYQTTQNVGDSDLELIHVDVNTSNGQTGTDILLGGSRTGRLGLIEVGKNEKQYSNGLKHMPYRIRPHLKENKAAVSDVPAHLWEPPGSFVVMSSSISSIKPSKKESHSIVNDGSATRRALITTLGSDFSGGDICILDLVEPLDFSSGTFNIGHRIRSITSLGCTVWTAECNSKGSQAVVGTNVGASLVDLESGRTSCVCRSKSDVLAEQVDQSGNVVLCGLRNGAVLTIDVREKWKVFTGRSNKWQSYCPLDNAVGPRKRLSKLSGNIDLSRTVYLPSSISCLLSLQFDNQYFLASSMDGSIKLYDHRLIQKGAVQSYEGHVNTHKRIELGVDPYERFIISGGSDCYFRLWSIKSGKLFFEEKFSDSILSNVCWERAEKSMGLHTQNDGWSAWLGSEEGLFHLNCSQIFQ